MDLSQFKGVVAIIAAAGIGSRMKVDTPKQYLKINRETILDITLNKMLSFAPIGLVVLVISPSDIYYKHLENIQHPKLRIVEGGRERSDSVLNALKFLEKNGLPDSTGVMVHDAARPCITHFDLDKLLTHFSDSDQACLLVAPVVDTLQKVDANSTVVKAIDRKQFVRALTPQMACFSELLTSLKMALKNEHLVTDEVSALTHNGIKVEAVIGRSDNIKVTHLDDLALVEFYLKKQRDSERLSV